MPQQDIDKERYCEPTDVVYTSNPAQYKCKNCGQMWYETQPRPKCLSNKVANKEECKCGLCGRCNPITSNDGARGQNSHSPSDKTWSEVDEVTETIRNGKYVEAHIVKDLLTSTTIKAKEEESEKVKDLILGLQTVIEGQQKMIEAMMIKPINLEEPSK